VNVKSIKKSPASSIISQIGKPVSTTKAKPQVGWRFSHDGRGQ
jgi:hypothetical protein